MTKQKDIFIKTEGDAWIERNLGALSSRKFGKGEPVINAASLVLDSDLASARLSVLEIGCGEGGRLQWMAENWDSDVYGIDPSAKAVDLAREKGVDAVQGTADQLTFDDGMFDLVIFGFCLYLCDREDLPLIARETDRILKKKAWVILHDFYASEPARRPYHHYEGLYSYKMDYRTIFQQYPFYYHLVQSHEGTGLTDNRDDWVATSLLRKISDRNE